MDKNAQLNTTKSPNEYGLITGVYLTTQIENKLPQSYIITHLNGAPNESADLGNKKSGGPGPSSRFLGIMRYSESPLVLINLCVIEAGACKPVGFSTIDSTVDMDVVALPKHTICVVYGHRIANSLAICDIVLSSKLNRPLPGYSLCGLLGNIQIHCYFRNMRANDVHKSVPPKISKRSSSVSFAGQLFKNDKDVNPILGVPFQLHTRLIPKIPVAPSPTELWLQHAQFKTPDQIMAQYNYPFVVENSTLNRAASRHFK